MDIILSIAILVYSSVLHEIAHGYAAYQLGDPTAKLKGRLTLNPVSHIDPMFSLLMPLLTYIATAGNMIFGGAKPVPVDPFNLRDGRKDLAIVSLAGPATNIALACLATIIIHILYPDFTFGEVGISGLLGFVLATTVKWNLLLAILNLIPIPPLDGSKIFSLILSPKTAAAFLSLEYMGFILVIMFFFFGGSALLGVLVNFSLSLLGF
jgi:Zn-dependent protease